MWVTVVWKEKGKINQSIWFSQDPMPNHEVERSWTWQTEEQREEVYGHTLSHRPDHYLLIVKLFRSVFLCVSEFLWKQDKKKMHYDGSQHCLLWVFKPLEGILRSSGTASLTIQKQVTEPSCSDTGLTCLVLQWKWTVFVCDFAGISLCCHWLISRKTKY